MSDAKAGRPRSVWTFREHMQPPDSDVVRAGDDSSVKMLHASHFVGYRAFQEKLARYIDPATQLLDDKHVEFRSCPACGGGEARRMFTKNGGTYVKCLACTMVYTNPVFKDDVLIDYYNRNIDFNAVRHVNELGFYTSIYGKGLNLIARHRTPGTLLDVGSSDGLFLDVSKRHGWQSSGIELNRAERELSVGKGHLVHSVELRELPPHEKYDVITMWDVFEHIKSGESQLREAAKRLGDGGLIFLQIPNSASLAARILREKCHMFDGVEHVNLYSPHAIKVLCSRIGMEILHFETVIDELKVIHNHLGYDDPYLGSFEPQPDLAFLSSELVLGSHSGYKMQIVMRPSGD